MGNLTGNLTKELITPVYVVALGLSPATTGLAMIVFRIYDAMLNPLVGWISDNTRTRWGRRRPYLVAGAILCALAMPLMWLVDRSWSHSTLLAWLIGSGLILYTCAALFGVPYESFSLELTPDYHERTRVNSYKMIITSVTNPLIGWSWYITQLPVFNDPQTGKPDTLAGALGLSLVLMLFVAAFGLAPALFGRERYYAAASRQPKVSLWGNFSAAFRNRPFLILVAISVCAVVGSFLTSGFGFYVLLYYVCQGDQALAAKILGVQATCWMPISIAAVFVFQAICNRWSKHQALAVALCFSFASMACRWWICRPDQPWLYVISNFLLAVGITGMWQLLPAMNADVIDSDELKSAVRLEGAFAAVFSWFMKLSFTLGIGLPGIVVQWTGFVVEEGAAQRPGIITALRLWDVLLPGGLTAVAILLIAFYPLTVARMGEIRRELEARRGRL